MKERATALLAALDSAPTHALDRRYPLDSIRRVVDAQKIDSGATARDIANADVLLTAAYVGYASDMLMGRSIRARCRSRGTFRRDRRRSTRRSSHTLEDSSMADGLAQMAPQDSEYAVLRREYARYREIAAQGGWPKVEHRREPEELQSRLDAEGYSDSNGGFRHDGAQAVAGASRPRADGKIGKATFAALNVPADERVDQIALEHRAASLAAARARPALRLRERPVVPARRVRLGAARAVDEGRRRRRVQRKSTPVFSDSMRWVVFRPYWRPTTDIIKKEILPKLKTDTSYLARNDMEWAKEDGVAQCSASAPARTIRSVS